MAIKLVLKNHNLFLFAFSLFVIISCSKNDINEIELTTEVEIPTFISAVDISQYPEISKNKIVFYNSLDEKDNFLDILKNNGINTVRLKIWVNPNTENGSFKSVKDFSKTLKNYGFKIWITIHYSDTWADPSKQITPKDWQNLNYISLKNEVYNYTQKIMTEIQPDYIQIGNEINTGFLHPYGNINDNYTQFIELLTFGIRAVRNSSSETKIILHFAGLEDSDWFFNKTKSIDYDIIGLSYYPIWHGKSMSNLKDKMQNLASKFEKKILIAETAYPFTLDWNDWTNNIVGLDEHLILPEYSASEYGQAKFISDIKNITNSIDNGIGFCYWGAELISWKGDKATDASPWENQALFDFNNKALHVLKEFNE